MSLNLIVLLLVAVWIIYSGAWTKYGTLATTHVGA